MERSKVTFGVQYNRLYYFKLNFFIQLKFYFVWIRHLKNYFCVYVSRKKCTCSIGPNLCSNISGFIKKKITKTTQHREYLRIHLKYANSRSFTASCNVMSFLLRYYLNSAVYMPTCIHVCVRMYALKYFSAIKDQQPQTDTHIILIFFYLFRHSSPIILKITF